MNEDRTFLGNGWSFPPALDKDGTPTRMSAYEENIRQSLWTLLSTSPGERVHRYDYGCPVRRYVFEIMDISTQTLLRDEIAGSGDVRAACGPEPCGFRGGRGGRHPAHHPRLHHPPDEPPHQHGLSFLPPRRHRPRRAVVKVK